MMSVLIAWQQQPRGGKILSGSKSCHRNFLCFLPTTRYAFTDKDLCVKQDDSCDQKNDGEWAVSEKLHEHVSGFHLSHSLAPPTIIRGWQDLSLLIAACAGISVRSCRDSATTHTRVGAEHSFNMVTSVAPEPATAQVAGTGFSISNQVVLLDISLASRRLLKGKTLITILPESEDLKIIQLHCKQCIISRVTVNNKSPSHWSYHTPWKGTKLHGEVGVHQFAVLEEKLNEAEDIVVHLPRGVKVEPFDPTSMEAQNSILFKSVDMTRKEGNGGSAADLSQSVKASPDQAIRFNPLFVFIEWTIDDIKDGLNFVGWEEGDLRYPHAYTTGKAQFLFPCVDTLNMRCSWDIRIRYAATLGDLKLSVTEEKSEESDWKNREICVVALGEEKPVDPSGFSIDDVAPKGSLFNPREKLQFDSNVITFSPFLIWLIFVPSELSR